MNHNQNSLPTGNKDQTKLTMLEKSIRFIKKLFKVRLFVYVLTGTLVTVGILLYIENIYIKSDNQKIKQYYSETKDLPEEREVETLFHPVPDDAKNVHLTDDRKYLSYISNGMLYVDDVEKKTTVKEIKDIITAQKRELIGQEAIYKEESDKPVYIDVYSPLKTVDSEAQVIYSHCLSDRNRILFFSYDGEWLAVKTYDMQRDDLVQHNTFQIRGLKSIDNVCFSVFTNVIYFNVEIESKGKTTHAVYRVNIMKQGNLFIKESNIKNMALLNHEDTLIYQNGNDRIIIDGSSFKYEDYKTFNLLGVDAEDRLYLQILDKPEEVLVLKDKKLDYRITLSNPNYVKSLNKDNHVYLLYEDSVVDLTASTSHQLEPGATFENINLADLIFKDVSNKVVIQPIKSK